MNTAHAIDQQFVYLARLQEMQPDRPVLVQRPQKWDSSLKGKFWVDWHNVYTTKPLLTCSVLNNEIALDPDLKDWSLLKKEIDQLTEFLDLSKIPYLLSWSGGSGVHLEIFFTKNISIPDDIAENINKIDIGITIRVFLANWILKNAGIDPELIKLDWGKIKWSSTSKGSMIRVFGCIRSDGGQKTLIDVIPDERPKPGALPLHFPSYLEQWDISFLQDEIIEAIQADIYKYAQPASEGTSWLTHAIDQARAEGRIQYPNDGNGKNCAGLQTALKGGIAEGNRDSVATGISYALRFWKNESQENILTQLSRWCTKCNPPLDFKGRGIDTKIINICRKSRIPENNTPCTFFMKAGLCNGSSCAVMRKRGARP